MECSELNELQSEHRVAQITASAHPNARSTPPELVFAGFTAVGRGIQGFPWIFTRIHGIPWKPIEIHGNHGFGENPWFPIKINISAKINIWAKLNILVKMEG